RRSQAFDVPGVAQATALHLRTLRAQCHAERGIKFAGPNYFDCQGPRGPPDHVPSELAVTPEVADQSRASADCLDREIEDVNVVEIQADAFTFNGCSHF